MYRFTFTYLPSFDMFVLTFGFFLCRLLPGCKGSIECMDATMINEQSDELSRKVGNILFIVDNISYTIYIYLKYN